VLRVIDDAIQGAWRHRVAALPALSHRERGIIRRMRDKNGVEDR
jgi:hypothetical protein